MFGRFLVGKRCVGFVPVTREQYLIANGSAVLERDMVRPHFKPRGASYDVHPKCEAESSGQRESPRNRSSIAHRASALRNLSDFDRF